MRNFKIVCAALALAFGGAYALGDPIPSDILKFGNKQTSAEKKIVFDTNDGASNKIVGVNATTKNIRATSNTLTLGDGVSSDKKFIADKGSVNNPFLVYSVSDSKWKFTNDGTTLQEFGSGSGGGSSGSGIEAAENTCELDRLAFGGGQDGYVNGRCQNFRAVTEVTGILLQTLSSGSSSAYVAWNPKYLDSTNPDSNFDSNFTAVSGSDASNINTNATVKIGTSVTSWDKTGSATTSCIQRDLGATATTSVSGNRTVLVWLQTPTISNFSSWAIRLSSGAASPTNYAEFRKTTDIAGTAVTASTYQLYKFTISTSPDATGGSGWLPTDPLRTFAICSNWSSSGQTATDQLFDALVFVPNSGAPVEEYKQLFPKGSAFTIANGTTSERAILDVASSDSIGPVTLTATASNTYTGGSGSTVRRSVVKASDRKGNFNTDTGLTAGTIANAQQFRLMKTVPAALSNATIKSSVTFNSPLYYTVSQITSGTQFKVASFSDDTANLKSGNALHVCDQYFASGSPQVACTTANNKTLTADATFAANQITFTIADTTGMSVGQFVWKANQVTTALSVVDATANESYTTQTLDTNPIVQDLGIAYPGVANIAGHFWLGASTEAEALKNRQGGLPALTKSGTPSTSGEFAISGDSRILSYEHGGTANGTDYYFIADNNLVDPDSSKSGSVSFSVWFNRPVADSGNAVIISKGSNASGWSVFQQTDGGGDKLVLRHDGTDSPVTASVPTTGAWHHVAGSGVDGGTWTLCLDAVCASTATQTVSATTFEFRVGTDASANNTSNMRLADLVVWSGRVLSQDEITQIYNAGRHRPFGFNPQFKYRYTSGIVSGQKITLEATMSRVSNAILPFLTKVLFLQQ